jgi:hypothetical protein
VKAELGHPRLPPRQADAARRDLGRCILSLLQAIPYRKERM